VRSVARTATGGIPSAPPSGLRDCPHLRRCKGYHRAVEEVVHQQEDQGQVQGLRSVPAAGALLHPGHEGVQVQQPEAEDQVVQEDHLQGLPGLRMSGAKGAGDWRLIGVRSRA